MSAHTAESLVMMSNAHLDVLVSEVVFKKPQFRYPFTSDWAGIGYIVDHMRGLGLRLSLHNDWMPESQQWFCHFYDVEQSAGEKPFLDSRVRTESAPRAVAIAAILAVQSVNEQI
jgi:hypothetical protein